MEDDPNKITILLLSPLPPPVGGIATWTTNLLEEAKNHPNIKVQHLDLAVRWRKSVNLSRYLQLFGGSVQALRDILRAGMAMVRIRPQVLHLTTSAGYSSVKDAVILLLGRIFRKPGIIHYHTSAISSYRNTGGWKLQAALLTMRLAKRVVVLDGETYTFLQKMVPSEKLIKIPNMIDVDRIDSLVKQIGIPIRKQVEGRRTHLLFVGYVIPEKGVVEQVEACAQLANVELHLIGPVREKFQQQLEDLAQYREGGSWLHFYGEVNEEEVYRRIVVSDILLLPSYAEGFPMSLLEGMVLSKPLVVSEAGAMPEIIDKDEKLTCGICVERGSTESLKRGLQSLLDCPESWQLLGQRGRERVETLYSSGSVVKELTQVWEEMAMQY